MANSRLCSIDGCGKLHHARGWCKAHYATWLDRGDATKAFALRRWLNDHKTYCGDECLIWPFRTNPYTGYGHLVINRHEIGAHRAMCILAHGEPPSPKHHAAHLCGKGHTGCVNPMHLRWATPRENSADRIRHGTTNRGEQGGRAKLRQADVLTIRKRLGAGETKSAIARDYSVSDFAIYAIATGRTWAWLQ